jgi:hypothetical protein
VDTIAEARSTGVRIERVDPGGWVDADAEPLAAVDNASSAVDSPHEAPVRASQLRLRLLHGQEGPPVDHLLVASRGDTTVGYLQAWFGHWDNPDVASLDPLVHPDVRGDDVVADALVDEALELCRADGRTSMISDAWHDSWLAAYWERRGWPVVTRTAQRRIVVADLDPAVLERLQAEAEQASAAYDIEVLPFPTPAELAEPMLDVHRAMNDAPLDDLRLEGDKWSLERLRASEAAVAARGVRLHTLIARRRADGAIGGFTEVAVDPAQPEIGDQGDTGVIGAHRGHRLGLRLKVAMLRRLAEAEPELVTIDTWNAESNDHMIAVNAQLGCFVVARGVLVQHDLG